jgi:hypothetical protein
MEFLHTLFASTAVLWCTLIGLFITTAILLENEFEGWATTVVSLSLALFIWLNQEAVFGFIKHNPSQLLGFIGSYIVVGIVWSIVKWQLYVRRAFKPLKEIKAEFITKFKVLDEKTLVELNKMISNANIEKASGYSNLNPSFKTPFEDTINELTPLASKKKSVITSWLMYWPVSFLATLLNNPFKRFFIWIYDNISGLYDKITDANKKILLKD